MNLGTQSVYIQVDQKGSSLDWIKVRDIPRTCKGWDIEMDRLRGTEEFGTDDQSIKEGKAWGIKFANK